jgi:mycofactocin system FadH/OYE family oxidoreductase 1
VTSLLEALAVGPRTARNRVVFGPHETNLGRGRAISDRHVAYYRRRAAGGAGIVVTEEASVHPSDWPMERSPLAQDCGPGWARVADACHDEGALVLAAIGHSGGQGTSHWSQRELWAPSPVPEVNTREVPKEMEEDDIEAVVDGFASAAALAVSAGCDGVEVNAGQHSLVRQFLSGLTNSRGDGWGQERTRFAMRVLAAVRAAVGTDALVALRLSCDELAPWAGITPEQAPGLAVDLVTGAGRVDLLTVVRGSIYSVGSTRPDGHTPPGFNLDLCRSVRDAVHPATDGRVPVVAQGSIVDVGQATWAVDDGVADAVEMTRAQLADAQLVAKVRSGTPERIRPCVLCNQQCAVRDNRNPIVSCTVDPSTGHELDEPELVALDDPGHRGGSSSGGAPVLVVVGGGPAGLELARVAAGGGRPVRVVERGDEPGGLLATIARLPGRERFADLASWLRDECVRAGVEVATGVAVTPELVDGWIADGLDVVLAVGGSDGSAGVPVDPSTRCWTPTEVLQDGGASIPDGDVLVWDPIGGPIGVGVAEVLAAGGRTVHLATQDLIVANELARAGDLAPANARLARAGVVLHRRSVLRGVTPLGATLEDRFTARRSSIEVAAVVDAGHRLPATFELRDDGRDLVVIGDAVAPRTVHEAILEGRRAASGR